MKKLSLILLTLMALAPSAALRAQTPDAAANTAAIAEPATEQAEPEAPKTPSPEDFVDSVIAYMDSVKEYSVKFSLIQPLQPSKKLNDEKKEALRNEFEMMYSEQEDGWLMRLDAIRGHHQNTVVVYNKDVKAGDYKYFVYKPAGLTVLPQNDPRVKDIPSADYRRFVKTLRATLEGANQIGALIEGMNSENQVVFEYLPATNSYVMQVSGELSRTVSYFSGDPMLLIKQELFVKKGKEYFFKRSMEWSDFTPGPQNPARITAVPKFR